MTPCDREVRHVYVFVGDLVERMDIAAGRPLARSNAGRKRRRPARRLEAVHPPRTVADDHSPVVLEPPERRSHGSLVHLDDPGPESSARMAERDHRDRLGGREGELQAGVAVFSLPGPLSAKKGSESLRVDSASRVDTEGVLGLGPPCTWMSGQLGPSRVVREVVGVDALSSAQQTILSPPFQIRPGRFGPRVTNPNGVKQMSRGVAGRRSQAVSGGDGFAATGPGRGWAVGGLWKRPARGC
jgi:hypothetical protein